ncbi:prepilin peptidase [Candidatus Bodocaedibacter vickermanii]|uniref:Type 4 prepilin-like proteins leader peptide-processing enzyme n=1 Tax=Candidatus Bodocaedibacter vickermanii TaxID=2741701 RepID=A0A7L9RV62_9PROT|nr:type 4 prepilin-like proteins leader peptide-processing enzyme [Candidatus Paracaedibacteraceae bacterium 'Lake Konstanz']
MFYPIQSIGYTWNTSKKIYGVFSGYSFISRLMIISGVAAFLIFSGLNYSIGFGVLCGLLFWISMIDMYDRIIPDILLIGILLNLWIIGACVYPTSIVLATGLILIKLGLEALYKKTLVGWGDVKLLTLCLAFSPLQSIPALLFISGSIGLIMALLIRSKEFPFAPAIILGFLGTYML